MACAGVTPVTVAPSPRVRAPAELARTKLVAASMATTPAYHFRVFMAFAPFSRRLTVRGKRQILLHSGKTPNRDQEVRVRPRLSESVLGEVDGQRDGGR